MNVPPMEFGGSGEGVSMTCTVRPAAARGFRAAGRQVDGRSGGAAPGRAASASAGGSRSRIVLARMRPTRILPALLALTLLVLAPPARAAWHALEEIPVESPVYKWVEDLASSYSLSSGLLLTKPWTRAELGQFLDQLVADQPEAARDPVVHRLRRELDPEGGIRGGLEPMVQFEEEDASLEISPYVRLGYAEDKARELIARDQRVGAQMSAAFGEYGLIFVDAYVGPA